MHGLHFGRRLLRWYWSPKTRLVSVFICSQNVSFTTFNFKTSSCYWVGSKIDNITLRSVNRHSVCAAPVIKNELQVMCIVCYKNNFVSIKQNAYQLFTYRNSLTECFDLKSQVINKKKWNKRGNKLQSCWSRALRRTMSKLWSTRSKAFFKVYHHYPNYVIIINGF